MAFIPTTRVHWLYWLALVWCSVYLLMNLSWWLQNNQQQQLLNQSTQLMRVVPPVQFLIHQLQTERGLSAGQVTPSLPYKPALQLQYLLTNAAWRDLTQVLDQQPAAPEQSTLRQLMEKTPLMALRQQVLHHDYDTTAVDGADIIQAYSAVIKPLLKYLRLLQQDGEQDWQRHSRAMMQLTEMIERSGLERAMLHIAMAEQEMSAARYQTYVFTISELRDHQLRFEHNASDAVHLQWQQWQQQARYQQLMATREQALKQQFSVAPALWFALSTDNINQLYLLQQQLRAQLMQDVADANLVRQQMAEQLQLNQKYMVLVLLLLLWRMHRLNIMPRPERTTSPRSTGWQQIEQG